MAYLWVRCFDDDACWRMMSLCYAFAAYPSLYWPLLMLVSIDVQVLESDVGDLATATNLWRSFLNLGIFVLKMDENLGRFLCGIGCYRISYKKPTGCPVTASPLKFHIVSHFWSMRVVEMSREGL